MKEALQKRGLARPDPTQEHEHRADGLPSCANYAPSEVTSVALPELDRLGGVSHHEPRDSVLHYYLQITVYGLQIATVDVTGT